MILTIKTIFMEKRTVKEFVNAGEIISVAKEGRFIFALKRNGLTDIYKRKKKSYMILIAVDVVNFHYRKGYLFFECQKPETTVWSCIKENDIEVFKLGKAVDDFFVFKRDKGYKISFFDCDGKIKSLFGSSYFYSEEKEFLVVEVERSGTYRLWAKRSDGSDSDCKYFASKYCGSINPVYILRDAAGVEWAFIPAPPYYAGYVKKLRKADSHLRRLSRKGRPYRRTLVELFLILKNKMFN